MSTALCCRRSRPQLLRSDYDGHRLSSGPTCRVLSKKRQISRRLTHTQYTSPSSTLLGSFLFFPSFLLHFFFLSLSILILVHRDWTPAGRNCEKKVPDPAVSHTCIIFGPGI